MTPKQERFCEEYLVDLNATQAAIRAGYSKKTANEQGARLLVNVSIQNKIQEFMNKRSERTKITADRVLQELEALGLSNIQNYVEKSTKGFVIFKDIDKIPEDAARAIESIKANYKEGRIEFKLYSKGKALEDIGRHLGMFTDIKLDAGEGLKAIIERIFTDTRPKENGE